MKWLVAFLACIGIAQAQVIQHQISDDGFAHIPLQFHFPYYGRIFTDSYMFSNGVVGFGSVNNHWCCSGYDLRYAQGYQFNYSIMGLQTDLINYGQGRFLTEGTPQYQRYMWENISEYGRPNNLNTFGIEIRPSGFIGMYYEKVHLDRPFTIGMTGDTSLGEYTQHLFQNGMHTETPFNYLTTATGDMCLVNPLYSPTCSGYEQAYTNQQCSINPLYRPSCAGYEEAYFQQQCSLNPLYNRNCDGYATAYATQQVTTAPTVTVATPTLQVSTTGTVSMETPVISDPVVNEVITRPAPQQTTTTVQSQTSPVQTVTQSETKQEKKTESKSTAQVKRAEVKNDVAVATITQPVHEYKPPIILDMAYIKMVKKPIQDNNKAMYRLLMNSQLKHEEMVNEQYRKRD